MRRRDDRRLPRTDMGYKVGLRLREFSLVARGSQEAGFTQPRVHLIAHLYCLPLKIDDDFEKGGREAEETKHPHIVSCGSHTSLQVGGREDEDVTSWNGQMRFNSTELKRIQRRAKRWA